MLNLDPRCPATAEGLVHLAKLKALESVEFHGGETEQYRIDEFLAVLKQVPRLKSLRLTETGVSDAGVAQIGEMKSLESLTIHQDGRITDRAIDTISNMSQLKSLEISQYVFPQHLGKMSFSAEALHQLSRLVNLEFLILTGIPAPGEILVPPRAKGLSLTGPEINDEVAARIAMCHDLTSLTLSGTAITDEGLRQIAEGTRLQRLTLTDARFTDAGLAHLAKLPLRHLELRGAHLTNATFIHHAKIPTLVRMDIMNSRSALTIDGMTALKEAPRLRTLWITGFPHDANYAALGELKQLRELHFEMSLTELRDLETLEVALPHTRIMAGTGGGWVGGFGRERKKPPTPKAK